jgi:nitrate reductase alpha subunit
VDLTEGQLLKSIKCRVTEEQKQVLLLKVRDTEEWAELQKVQEVYQEQKLFTELRLKIRITEDRPTVQKVQERIQVPMCVRRTGVQQQTRVAAVAFTETGNVLPLLL